MKFLPSFVGSFYDPATYERVRYSERGNGLLYAFTLVSITTFIACIMMLFYVHQVLLVGNNGKPPVFDDVVHQVAAQLPEMSLINGDLLTSGPQPLKIYIDTTIDGLPIRGPVITIDTSGATSYKNMETPMLITKTETITRQDGDAQNPDGKNEIQSHKKIFGDETKVWHFTHDDFVVMADEFVQKVHSRIFIFYLIFGGFFYLFLTALFFLLRIVMLLALAVVAVIMGNASGRQAMEFSTGLRIASVAYTPVAICSGISFLWMLKSPSSPVLFALGALMLLFVISATRKARA
jgi:hypothetical protein